MNRTLLPLAVSCLLLAGCGSSSESPDAPDRNGTPQVPEPVGFASTYTEYDGDACELLSSQVEEGSSSEARCPGFGKVPLFVQEGDGRFDLDAGIDDDNFQTIGAFNDFGETIEWRLEGNEPFAFIFRYRDVTMEANGRTVLAVETVGSEGKPGCRVAHIAGDAPEANQQARDFADAAAADGFSCPEQPELVGNAG